MKRIFIFFILLLAPIFSYAMEDSRPLLGGSDFFSIKINTVADVKPQDLEIKEPKILPNSNFYWMKELFRSIELSMTADESKKTQKLIRISNERLYELKKLTGVKKIDKKTLEKYLEKYLSDSSDLYGKLLKIQDEKKAKEILDSIVKQEFIRQRVFEGIQNKTKEDIVEAYKQKSLEKFGKLLSDARKLEPEKRIKEYADKNIKFDAKSIQDTKFLEKLKNYINNKETQKTINDAADYAVKKIIKSLEDLNEEDKQKKIREFLGDTSTTTQDVNVGNLLERIKEEKDRIEKDLQKNKIKN